MRTWHYEVGPAGTALSPSNVAATDATAASTVAPGSGTIQSSSLTPGVKQGSYCAEIISATSGSSIIRHPFETSHDAGAASVYWSCPATPSSTAQWSVLTFRTGSGAAWGVYVNNANRLVIYSVAAGANVATSTATITYARRNRLEVTYDRATGTVTANLYNDDSTTADVTVSASGANLGAASYASVDVGFYSSPTSSVTSRFDALRTRVGGTGEIGPLSNTPPTASVPAYQIAAAAASVSATVTASDPDGSIASYAWTVVETSRGSSPTLTGASTSTVSLTAGAKGDVDRLRCRVTDDGGAYTDVFHEVRVLDDSTTVRHLPFAQSNGSWTRAGAATTDGAALSDELDTTYLESVALSSTETASRVRLRPMVQRSSLQLVENLCYDGTGTPAAVYRLYQGTTLRQSWTVTGLTTTDQQFTFTASGATVAALGSDWSDLSVELAGTA